jgi:integrase
MKQARVLTDAEFKRLMAVVAQMKHGPRNRLALMLSHLAGLRVGEIAALVVRDVIDSDGKVREQIRLSAEITKGGHARVVFVGEKLRREIDRYRTDWKQDDPPDAPLLSTHRRRRSPAIRFVNSWDRSIVSQASMGLPRIVADAGSLRGLPIRASADHDPALHRRSR